jgi:thermitase
MRLGAAIPLSVIALVALPAGAHAAAPAVPGQLLVGFKSGVSSSRQDDVLSAVQGRLAKRFKFVRGGRLTLVKPRSGKATDALLKRLKANPDVAYAEPDFYLNASVTPNDPFYFRDWAVNDTPGGHDISAPEAWNTRTSCTKVAVLDTGVDTDHPDLQGNIYKSPDVPNNNKDDDKNGYVDDTYGWNVITGKGSGEDDNGHGTHVSGIIAGRGNNGVGVAGICWSATIVAVKFMNSQGKGSTSDAIDGMEYASKKGAKIINASFGCASSSSSLKDAVGYVQDHGGLLVVAAGNDSENIDKDPEYPAAYSNSNILTVAASTDTDTLASFSNYGSTNVDVAAPGDDIYST